MRVSTGSGVTTARVTRSSEPLAVGDWVLIEPDTDKVAAILERSTLLVRRDPTTGDEQPIAANVDIVVAVLGLDRDISAGFVERLTTVAWDSGARPLIVLTKAEVVADPDTVAETVRSAAPYVDVLIVSAHTGLGLGELRHHVDNATIVMIGTSGAGKSTLANELAGKTIAATGEVRTADHKGRHTTTARQLHVCPPRLCVIDTPGVRELGISTDIDTLDASFPDIVALGADCRFADCGHTGEPDCAVLSAVADGDLEERRLASWHQLRREAASSMLRADPHAHRNTQRQQARIYREAQQHRRRKR